PARGTKTKPHNLLGVLKMNAHSLSRSTFLAIAIAGVGLVSWAMGASAATPDGEVRKQVVSYADLKLDHAEGIAKLYQRVRNAADRVCAPLESRELYLVAGWRECINAATSRAV